MGLVKQILSIIRRIFGLDVIFDKFSTEPWAAIILILCVLGTMAGLVRVANGKPLAEVSKGIGGVLMGILKVMIGVAFALWAVHFLVGLGAGMIGGAIRQIPLIGGWLADAWNWAVGIFMSIVMAIMIGVYILKNVTSLMSRVSGALEGGMQSWQGNGPGGVKWSYILVTAFSAALFLCHPSWNAPLYYVPAMIFGLSGLGIFVYSTATGKKLVDAKVVQAKTRFMNKPGPAGEWTCKSLVYQHDPKTGNITFKDKTQAHYSKLPKLLKKGKEPVLVPCHHHNTGEDTFCDSTWCDHPNPFKDWVCKECGKKGLKWDMPKCKECGTLQPKRPVKTAPTTPDTDKHSRTRDEEEAKEKKAKKKKEKAQPTAPQAPPVPGYGYPGYPPGYPPPQPGYPPPYPPQGYYPPPAYAYGYPPPGHYPYPAPPYGYPPQGAVPPQAAPPGPQPARQCSKGHTLEANAAFCQVCGERVQMVQRPAAAPAPAPPRAARAPEPTKRVVVDEEENDMDSMLFH